VPRGKLLGEIMLQTTTSTSLAQKGMIHAYGNVNKLENKTRKFNCWNSMYTKFIRQWAKYIIL